MRNRDIIKQYVNTGECIPKYQFDKLTTSLLKTYMRKRCSEDDCFEFYEVQKMSHEQKENFIQKSLMYVVILSKEVLDALGKDMLDYYIKKFSENLGFSMTVPLYYYVLFEYKFKNLYIENCVKRGSNISEKVLHILTPEKKDMVIRSRLNNRNTIPPDYYFNETNDYDLKMMIIKSVYKRRNRLSLNYLDWLSENNREYLLDYLETNIYFISVDMVKFLNDDQFERYLIYLRSHVNMDYWCDLSYHLTYKQKIEYIKYILKNDLDYVFSYNTELKNIAKENNLI